MDGISSLDPVNKMKLTVDQKTGKFTGSEDVFAEAAEQIYQSKMVMADRKEDEKKDINLKLEALSTLEGKVADLKGKSALLFKDDGMGNYGVFSNMFANFSSTSATPVSSLFDLSLASTSNLQEFSLEITQVASYDLTNSATAVTDPTVPLNWTGPYTVNGQVLTIAPTMCLNDICTLLNSQSSNTLANASVIQVSSTSYVLSLQAQVIGTPMTIVDGTSGGTAGQLPAASGNTPTELAALFTFNGISMQRTSNNVNDIVEGLTLVLKNYEAGTTMTVRLSQDTASIKAGVRAWAQSINDVMDEVNKHRMSFKDHSLPKDALLLGSDIIQTVDNVIRTNLATSLAGAGPNDFSYLEQIGLNVDLVTNKIVIDEDALDSAVTSNAAGVQKFFDYQQTISNDNFLVPFHPACVPSSLISDSNNNPLTTTVTVNKDAFGNVSASITISGGIYAGQTFNIPSNQIQARGDNIIFLGDSIQGVTDNPYAGFEFAYVGVSGIANSSSDSTTLNFTQGVGNRMTRGLHKILEPVSGDFSIQKKLFTENIKKIDEAVERITKRAEMIKEKYLDSFMKLQVFLRIMEGAEHMIDAFTRKPN